MVDKELLSRKISNLSNYISELKNAKDINWEKYTRDSRSRAFVERYLHLAIEEVFDIANHLVSFLRWREPTGYRDLFSVLHEQGIIPDSQLSTFQNMASFRNMLVHHYEKIDDEVVFGLFKKRLSDFILYIKLIKEWTETKPKQNPVKITHLGAKNCVTGSCHLIQTQPDSSDNINILVDCGKAYGKDPELPFDKFPVQPANVDYLFLTHAHIDHIGRVPDIIDAGFKGEIICTHATKALLTPMLHDAMSFSNRTDRQTAKIENKIDDLSWGFELYETFSLKKGITFKLSNAGHILGSCFILFNFPVPDSKDFKVIFSGDLGCKDTPILPDPDPPDVCDLLVLESTYGDRNHTNRKDRVSALKKLLQKALKDKGIVYIPAFSLGRTQELIYELDRIKTKVPVFIDSPLGLKITKIYSTLEEFWDKEAKTLKLKGDHPIDFKNLYAVQTYRDHKQLLNIKGPAIIVAGSGMCTGGRIVDHLKHGLEDPTNDIFFVGYQAKGTPGRKMIEKQTPAKARIHTLTGYSAHADQNTLVNWVRSMPKPPEQIHLVHGEPKARKALFRALGLKV